VIWNLVRNAIQASSAGDEVTVNLERKDQEASAAQGAGSGARIVLSITDSGPGIAPAARERLFDAFFTTRSHGVGIGLAVVKRILDDHAFTIEVESGAERGTTFRVLMPKPTGAETAEAAAPATA